jgi:hypothetical protein
MSGKLSRPHIGGEKIKDYHEHCRNIARLISRANNQADAELKIHKYLVAVGLTT